MYKNKAQLLRTLAAGMKFKAIHHHALDKEQPRRVVKAIQSNDIAFDIEGSTTVSWLDLPPASRITFDGLGGFSITDEDGAAWLEYIYQGDPPYVPNADGLDGVRLSAANMWKKNGSGTEREVVKRWWGALTQPARDAVGKKVKIVARRGAEAAEALVMEFHADALVWDAGRTGVVWEGGKGFNTFKSK